MSLDIGFFLLYAIVASIPAALVGGWLYGLWLGRSNPAIANLSIIGDEAAESTPGSSSESVPSGTLSILVLLVPVLLILFGSIFGVLLPEEMWITSLLRFLGDKNVALLIGVFFAFGTLRRHLKKPASVIVTESAAAAGLILLITGAGGAFGHVISTSGIGPYLVETMSQFNISLLILGFLLSAILRAAQGSATVALVTTSAILGPTVASVGTSPILVGLAICAGGMCLSLPNDSGFWVVSRFANLSVRDTLKAWTVGGSLGGLVALAVVLILDSMRGVLPGI